MAEIVMATKEDTEEILELYHSMIGAEFCPWNENYPGKHEIEFDLSRDALYVMKDENGKLMAAISLEEDEAVDALPFWPKELEPLGELARLAVRKDLQNQGIAREMIIFTFGILKRRGYNGVKFMVNSENKKALASYAHLDITKVGECDMYDQHFICYEKAI